MKMIPFFVYYMICKTCCLQDSDFKNFTESTNPHIKIADSLFLNRSDGDLFTALENYSKAITAGSNVVEALSKRAQVYSEISSDSLPQAESDIRKAIAYTNSTSEKYYLESLYEETIRKNRTNALRKLDSAILLDENNLGYRYTRINLSMAGYYYVMQETTVKESKGGCYADISPATIVIDDKIDTLRADIIFKDIEFLLKKECLKNEMYYRRIDVYYRMKQFENTLKELEEYQKLYPDDSITVLDFRSKVYYNTGKLKNAANDLTQLSNYFSKDSVKGGSYMILLSEIYVQLHDEESAIQILEKITNDDVHSSYKKSALEKLDALKAKE